MKIKIISEEQFNVIYNIYKEHSKLILQNTGYEKITCELSDADNKAIDTISNILKFHIFGFEEFNNFRLSNRGTLELRFQYSYSNSFIGVGYIELKELLKGFSYWVEESDNTDKDIEANKS